jgi:protein-S-isoprenylcysteine O-methyltransferase Ste14
MPDADNPGLALPPPILFGVALIAAILLEWLLPLSFLPSGGGWPVWLGFALAGAALALALWSARSFRSARTNVDPHKPATTLVTSGAFAYMRNPIYVAFLMMLAGVAFAGSLEWALILTPALWLALHAIAVLPEERYLTKFGPAYEDYKSRVRRWGIF